ncbi:FAD-binding oxidoreductase [Actinokineospora fastidiosa]|uniref:FAD-binding FR-type domain-containing protein n=1 Tax=Actinokineospora fastidiosa TaxID=1816 RepID=A0A918GAN2_9PSEU|nr:FAD-binding oxidoreductase [Actinokineospora fastidiosa]GGS26270.1 hypothetical protein GCM10010171_19650 [Actinokineospora fastidiosa]
MSALRLPVAEVVTETAQASSIVFDAELDYLPGQYLTLRVPSELTGSVARCYSLSSSPLLGERPQVTVKRAPDGYASNLLCDTACAGAVIEALPPMGVFTPKSLDADLLLFAGGSGITPILSIVKSALHAGTGRITLVYANRDAESVIFADALAALAAGNARLSVTHWLESERGLPSVEQLADLAAPHADADAFTCGPAPFMAAVTDALKELDFPRSRRHVERFASLAANPFDRLDSRAG